MSTFPSVVQGEQRNSEPQQNHPLAENENPEIISNKKQGMNKFTKIQKRVDSQPIDVGVEARTEACGKPPQKRELYAHGRKVISPHYRPTTRKQNFCMTLIRAWNGCS